MPNAPAFAELSEKRCSIFVLALACVRCTGTGISPHSRARPKADTRIGRNKPACQKHGHCARPSFFLAVRKPRPLPSTHADTSSLQPHPV